MFWLRDKSKLVKIHICNNWPLPSLFKALHLQHHSDSIRICVCMRDFTHPLSHRGNSCSIMYSCVNIFHDEKRFPVSFNACAVMKGYSEQLSEIQDSEFYSTIHRELHVQELTLGPNFSRSHCRAHKQVGNVAPARQAPLH